MTCKIQIEIQRPQTRDVHIWNPSCSFPGSALYSSYLQLSSSQHLCQPLLRFFPGGQEKLWTDISKLDGCTSQGCVSNLKKWKLQGWQVSILSFGSVVCSRFRIGRIDGSHVEVREREEREREGGRWKDARLFCGCFQSPHLKYLDVVNPGKHNNEMMMTERETNNECWFWWELICSPRNWLPDKTMGNNVKPSSEVRDKISHH
jgi:hypothetical protein